MTQTDRWRLMTTYFICHTLFTMVYEITSRRTHKIPTRLLLGIDKFYSNITNLMQVALIRVVGTMAADVKLKSV